MKFLSSIYNLFGSYIVAFAEEGAGSGSEDSDGGSMWPLFVIMGIMVVFMFVFPMISRKRRGGKQVNDMRTTLRIGDEVMTIGGIVGTVIEVNERSASDKDFVIETGAAGTKSTMLFDLRALHENRTRIAELREEAARQAEIDRINKENKRKERDNRRGKMS